MKNTLDPNIQSYIEKMKRFFKKNPYFYQQIFGFHPEELVFISIGHLAEKNYIDFGEPNLTREQLQDIKKEMDQKNDTEIFLNFLNYPPICLN